MRLPLPQFAQGDRAPNHIGEVIANATTHFVAQCLMPDTLDFPAAPAFGTWVRAQDEESGHCILGVVYHTATSPIDSVHRATALGLSIEQLREQQPQIFAMLKTEFEVAIAGYTPDQLQDSPPPHLFHHYLPARPPQVHQGVYGCEPELVIAFTEKFDFLRTLLQFPGLPNDALLGAVLRNSYQLRGGDRSWLVQAGRHLSVLLKDDYDRLRAIMGQVSLLS